MRRWAGNTAGSRPVPGGDPGSRPVSLTFRLLSESSGAAIAGLSGRMREEPRAGAPRPHQETTPLSLPPRA